MEHRRLKPARRCCFIDGGWSKRAREVHSIVTSEILAAISGGGTERSVTPSELIKEGPGRRSAYVLEVPGRDDCGLITKTPSSRRSKTRTQFLQATGSGRSPRTGSGTLSPGRFDQRRFNTTGYIEAWDSSCFPPDLTKRKNPREQNPAAGAA
jgi:hypothetical protein